MSEPEYKLYYFQQRGLGEPIRLILSYLNIPFDDIRVDEFADWMTKWKPWTPLGNVPVLVLKDGTKLSQSVSICRYLGEKHGNYFHFLSFFTGKTSTSKERKTHRITGILQCINY